MSLLSVKHRRLEPRWSLQRKQAWFSIKVGPTSFAIPPGVEDFVLSSDSRTDWNYRNSEPQLSACTVYPYTYPYQVEDVHYG